MKNKNSKYLLIVLSTIILASCVSSKKMVYFQDNENNLSYEDYEIVDPKIQVGDILSINISAIDIGAAVPFNLYESISTADPKPLTYIVNKEGEINFPVIGYIKVEGFTTKILTQKITLTLAEYLAKPIVNIRLVNFKVAVLGEVKTPGTYLIPNERITVIEAISLAGDLTIHGKRKTLMLIREQGGKRAFIKLDLTDKKIFSSPYFYLAQNDVIYVEPNKTKLNSSAVGANAGIILSSISSLISIIAILTR